MAKNQNTFAKRQRERIKKEKAQIKRERRQVRKQSAAELMNDPEVPDIDEPKQLATGVRNAGETEHD